ncbi:MAG: asparagine synthase (glutamine-hydrolyzing) [Bryobacteraceae bacterium]
MCAIAGILNLQSGEPVQNPRRANPDRLAKLRFLMESQRHRGPDGEGWFFDGEVALGHRRLAVLDLSPSGQQPMTSRNGRWTIVFNGEIFNYLELRSAFPGWRPESSTDTEVLLEAIAAWGIEGALDRARGMFAIAVWDARERELTLARDRAGEKPLVYYCDGKTFAFASELKALDGLHARRLDPLAVDAYLALGYVPAPLAIFRGCRKLEAGHLLRIRPGPPRTSDLRPERWWFPERAVATAAPERAARIEELREHLRESVRIRLRSDVPVALCLSGGVDSSVIAAEAAELGASIETFTVRFDGEETDLPHARAVARHLGLRHHVVDAPCEHLVSNLSPILHHYDEPFADSSAVPSFALAKAFAGRFKVVLNGDGGDEVFGGYNHYTRIAAKQAIKTAAAAAGFCDGRGSGRTGVYVQSKSLFRADERRRMLAQHSRGSAYEQMVDHFAGYAPTDPLKHAMWTDRHLQLANGLTYKVDIALGAFGIEGRAPFLDHTVMEWAQSLPASDLVAGSEKKILLRAAYQERLPDSVLERPKQGFGSPIERWLGGPLRNYAEELLPSLFFESDLQQSASGQRKWALLFFSAWAQTWRATW